MRVLSNALRRCSTFLLKCASRICEFANLGNVSYNTWFDWKLKTPRPCSQRSHTTYI